MKIKPIKLFVVASVFLSSLPAYAVSFDSNYTSIVEADCTTLNADEVGSVQSCPSFSNIKVRVTEGDLRQSIILSRRGIDYPLNFQETISANMSELGSKIEWRYQGGKPKSPVAMIVRFNVSENPEKPTKMSSYLIVSKITTDDICVVGKVPPQRQQNQEAHRMAEQSAGMPCLNVEVSSETNEQIYFDIKAMKWRDTQGICHTCTEANGFPIPVILDGFYYEPEDKLWHDGDDGIACHTCTPENGFPANPVQANPEDSSS